MSYKPDISLRAIARLASPIFVANLAIMGSAIIDTMMAGQLGAEHLAVVGVGSATIVMIVLSLAGVSQSLSPIAGHLYGAQQHKKIGFVLIQSLWIGVILTIIGLAIVLQTDFWIAFGKIQGHVAEMTRLFLIASAASLPAFIFSRPYVALNAAINRPKVAMWISLGMLLMKAPLNCVFMYGLFGFEAYGGAGCGIATAINGWLSFFAYILIWKLSHYYDAMRSDRFYWPDIQAIRQHLRIGIPIAFSCFFEVSSFTLMAIFISRLGTIPVASHQIVANITATTYQIPLSLGIASSVLVAQCLGAKQMILAKQAMLRVLQVAISIALVTSIVLILGRNTIVSFYTKDPEVANLAAALLIFAFFYHVADAIQTVCSFALRGYRVTFLPMVIFGICLWAIGLGGGYWLGFSAESFGGPYGPYGFWAATGVGLILTAIVLGALALYVSNERIKEYSH